MVYILACGGMCGSVVQPCSTIQVDTKYQNHPLITPLDTSIPMEGSLYLLKPVF